MPQSRYPFLIWSDAAGGKTAVLVGELESTAAYASSETEAVRQLKELLEWRDEHETWNLDPDLDDPELIEVKVEIRPQYQSGKRTMPCPETVWMKVPCVAGVQASGLRLCLVPHLGLEFNFQENADLKSLVQHYVKEALHGLSPLQLASRLPPQGCRLDEVVFQTRGDRPRRIAPPDREEFKVLFKVADPLLHATGRKRPVSAAYGREILADEIAHKLRREKSSLLLVGAPGSGKSTLLLESAKRAARMDRANPERDTDDEGDHRHLASYRIWRGNAARIIAGMRYLGEWEERCEEFIAGLTAIEGIFCAENLLELLQVGGQEPGNSVAAFLQPYLQRGELRMLAEATPAEVDACRRLLPGFVDHFEIVRVPPFEEAEAIDVLNRTAAAFAAGSKMEVNPGTVPVTYRLFKRFQPYSAFPGPAASFIRNLFDRRGIKSRTKTVTSTEVVAAFLKLTGLPETFLRDELLLPIEEVQRFLASKIIGQNDATNTVARVITTIKTGLNDPARPFGVLLFCGPTGVGKTALAHTMAEYCFGSGESKNRLIRLDMSEYGGLGAAQRFHQTPQGQPAAWIEQIRRQPFSVVLFDEIEKAAPEVFDLLLGLMDEGRLTDRYGRITWFRSAIVIMTSNLGAGAAGSAGFNAVEAGSYEAEISKFFRPEFFNRLDAVISFNPLSRADIDVIIHKELAELSRREGLASKGLKLKWDGDLIKLIAHEGYDQRLGARPLQRAIERLAGVPIARWLVRHPNEQHRTLILSVGEDGVIEVKPG